MVQFLFLVIFASLFVPNHSFGLSHSNAEDPSLRIFGGICSRLCDIQSRSFFYEGFHITVKPPILCGLCGSKGITSTTPSPPVVTSAPPIQTTKAAPSSAEAATTSAEGGTTPSGEAATTAAA